MFSKCSLSELSLSISDFLVLMFSAWREYKTKVSKGKKVIFFCVKMYVVDGGAGDV